MGFRPLSEPDAHWFRRSFHVFGASFVFYYIIPDHGIVLPAVKAALPMALFALAVVLEALRIRGRLADEYFVGLRNHEKARPSSYFFFGLAAMVLLYAFPPPIAAGCLLGSAVGDPLLGEGRRKGHARVGALAAACFGFASFAVLGFTPLIAALGAFLLLVGEAPRWKRLDDDFLMPMFPAVVLLVLYTVGVLGPLPQPFTHRGRILPWIP